MAYFSNGTEARIYQEQYCQKCVHDENLDCTVWVLHVMYGHDTDEDVAHILNTLIPVTDKGFADKCSMFSDKADMDGGD